MTRLGLDDGPDGLSQLEHYLMGIIAGAKIARERMDIRRNIEEVDGRIAKACARAGRARDEVTVIGAAKTVAPLLLRQAYEAGITDFGENRVQEARDKIAEVAPFMKPPPTWHMIGHLQTNKVKTAVEIFDIIHSIDSLRLAEYVNGRVEKIGFPILLEVNVVGESSKSGFAVADVPMAVEAVSGLGKLRVMGLMTIAPFVADPEEVRPVFRKMRQLRDSLGLEHLSMGMTDDFEVAIEEGSTMVRIGRAIFGERR